MERDQKNYKDIALILYNFAPSIVDISADEIDNNTPLINAAQEGRIDLINFLINECKANLWLKNNNGETFFHCLYTANPTLDLHQLTFFNNYDFEQKRLFLHSQLELFAQINFSFPNESKKRKFSNSKLYAFIVYCKQYGSNLNQRNNDRKRPLDIAYDQYSIAHHEYHNKKNSYHGYELFRNTLIKESIYRTFLLTTEKISDHELWYRLSRNGIVKDIYRHIIKYYYAVTIDSACVMADFKKRLLQEEYQQLGIRNINPDIFNLTF